MEKSASRKNAATKAKGPGITFIPLFLLRIFRTFFFQNKTLNLFERFWLQKCRKLKTNSPIKNQKNCYGL